MGAAYRRGAGLRESVMFHFALVYQIADSACHVLDGDRRIDSMLVEQIDPVCLEALQHALRHRSDVFGTAIQSRTTFASVLIDVPPEFRRDGYRVTYWGECIAHKLFICPRSVRLSRVEVGNTALSRCPDERGALLPVGRRPVAGIQAHAAEAEG